MLYENPIEVLEAMGYDPAFGARDWFGDHHVGDLRALARGCWCAQRGPVRYKRLVYGDPFGDDFERWKRELMIDPIDEGTAQWIEPTYYSYRPTLAYVAQKMADFLTLWRMMNPDIDYFDEGFVHEGRRYEVYLVHKSGVTNLATFPDHAVMRSPWEIKAELTRRLFEMLSDVSVQRTLSSRDYRAPLVEAAKYVDALWGFSM